jgi:hypothetical protein
LLEAGKRRLAGDTAREATSDEVKTLRSEARQLKESLAEVTLENRLLKTRRDRGWGGRRMRYAASEKLDIIRTVETSTVPNIIRYLMLAAPATHFVMLTQAVLVRGPAWVPCGRSFWRSSLLARRSSSSLSAASENPWMTLAVTTSSAELRTPLDCSITKSRGTTV